MGDAEIARLTAELEKRKRLRERLAHTSLLVKSAVIKLFQKLRNEERESTQLLKETAESFETLGRAIDNGEVILRRIGDRNRKPEPNAKPRLAVNPKSSSKSKRAAKSVSHNVKPEIEPTTAALDEIWKSYCLENCARALDGSNHAKIVGLVQSCKIAMNDKDAEIARLTAELEKRKPLRERLAHTVDALLESLAASEKKGYDETKWTAEVLDEA